jgi:hypothetical protein
MASEKDKDDLKLVKSATSTGKKRKSIVASGLLSFFFGPLGWLYAAPWKISVPAAALYVLLIAALPQFILAYLIMIICPISAIGGVLYALGFNMAGKRTPIFGKDGEMKKLTSRASS